MFSNSINHIQNLIDSNAYHLGKNKHLNDFTDLKILSHAAEEITELAASQDDKEEMADILSCLFHYCIRKGWSMEDIDNIMIKKMKERFSDCYFEKE